MSQELNRETGDHTKPVERRISVQIGAEMHHFSLWTSAYTASKLDREDWVGIGGRLRDHVATVRRRMALGGVLFALEAPASIRRSVEEAAKQFVYEAFKQKQYKAGNLQWQVDPLLSGEEYRV